MDLLIDEIRYQVEVDGEGFPFVQLHGFTGDSSTWTAFFDSWGKHSMVIAPDIIGHGKTESPEDLQRYKIESAAHDLAVILDQLGVNQVDMIGYSMGGRLALTFALLFPNRVRKLVLESTSPGLETEQERDLRCIKDAELGTFILSQGIERFVNYWENIPLFRTMKRLPLEVQKKVREQRLRNSPNGLANSLLGMGTGSQPSWWNHLGQLHCRVLLLTGEEDQKFCHIAERMEKKLKNGSWIVIKNSGHAIHVEQPEKFGTIVSDFLISN